MALSDNKRLYDISTRLAVYVEGVKQSEAKKFNFVLREIEKVLVKLLGRVRYKTLDGLSKAQLNKLVAELRESQSEIYSKYTSQLMAQLKAFMLEDLEVNRRVWVSAKLELDEESESEIVTDSQAIKFLIENENRESNPIFGLLAVTGANDRIWSNVTNTPIPANGLYLLPFVKTFSVSAQAGVENLIRRAWANHWTVEETLAELVGNGQVVQGQSSQLRRIENQASAVVHTAFAHVAAIGAVAVASSVFGHYGWFSVMDSNTTEICKKRNRKIYQYGNGPLPPAHIRCRSHTSPVNKIDDISSETFYTWLLRQPSEFQNDVLGETEGERLRNGDLKAKDVDRYEPNRPLTFEQFKSKIKEILTR